MLTIGIGIASNAPIPAPQALAAGAGEGVKLLCGLLGHSANNRPCCCWPACAEMRIGICFFETRR